MKYRAAFFILVLLFAFAQAEPRQSSGAVATVVHLYREFAWTAVIAEPEDNGAFGDRPRAVLGKYFSPGLIELLKKDRLCTSRTKEICGLDFDPIWASQDPAATEMKITEDYSRAHAADCQSDLRLSKQFGTGLHDIPPRANRP